MITRFVLPAGLLCLSLAGEASAWPAELMGDLARDARRLLPRSLAVLMAQREKQIQEEAQRYPVELAQAMVGDLSSGRLQPATMQLLDARAAEAVSLLRERRVSEGIVKLGALYRIPADLSDPVLAVGPEGYPPGVTREYYAFLSANLGKIPVVLDDAPALELRRERLPEYWQGLLGRTRGHSPVILTEMFQKGRVVDHRSIDFRSPVFGVASLAYSRAVTAIAATWLTLWRDARGDLTRRRPPRTVAPRHAPDAARATPAPHPSPEALER